MRRRIGMVAVFAFALALFGGWGAPFAGVCYAEGTVDGAVVEARQDVSPPPVGIQPVDQEKIEKKVAEIEGLVYGVFSPIIELVSKISILVAGALLLAFFIGGGVVKRVATTLGCVALGIALWANAGKIAEWFIVLGQWMGQ